MSHKLQLSRFLQKLDPINRPGFPYNKEAICSRHASFADFANQVCKDAEETTKARQHSRSGASHYGLQCSLCDLESTDQWCLHLRSVQCTISTQHTCPHQHEWVTHTKCTGTFAPVEYVPMFPYFYLVLNLYAMMICRFTGVSWGANKWHAYIHEPSTRKKAKVVKKHLGVFLDEEAAARAVDAARIQQVRQCTTDVQPCACAGISARPYSRPSHALSR